MNEDTIRRKDAIETAQRMFEWCDTGDIIDYRDMVVESLKVLPSVQQWCEYWDNESNFCALNKPPAQPERKKGMWSNHEVACIIADLMGDVCACNHNGIDEWLPMLCDFANTDTCPPHPVGVACWEQYLKWKGEDDD